MAEEFTDQDQAILDDATSGEEQDTDRGADDDSGQTQDTATGGGDDTGFSEDDRALAEAYGLDPGNFESPEALQSQVESIDRSWMDAARQRLSQPPQQYQQYQQQPQQETQPQVPFRLELDPETYGEEFSEQINGVLQQVHEYYQPVVQQLQQVQTYLQQQQIQQEYQQFDDAVGSLGHKELFGESLATATPVQQANAQRLYQEAEILAASYRMRNMPVPSVKDLVKKAESIAFAEQLQTYQQQTQNARLAKQSRQRLGSGRRSNTLRDKGKEWDGEPEDNPVLKEAWDRMVEEMGER